MWVLIPSYEPDGRLTELVARLVPWCRVVVVDDGSGEAYRQLFEASGSLGAVVLTHPTNRGKAAALRTGFAWLGEHGMDGPVVCADSDGQHLVEDIRAVGATAATRMSQGAPDAIVLGTRAFAGRVPLRSRIGNAVTSVLVAGVTGRRIADTQTGLRAYPPSLLPWLLSVPGERFSYELRMLLEASRTALPVVEVPIATVYLGRNEGSHFRPIADSWQVLLPVFLFAGSSLIAFGLDTMALLAFNAATGSLWVSIVVARVLSATVNFTLNRRTVFQASGPLMPQLARYAVLAAALLGGSYAGLWALTGLGVPLLAAKLVTDLTLFVASFAVQRAYVFGNGRASTAPSVELSECATSPESIPTTSR